MPVAKIAVEKLSKSFGPKVVLDGFDLNIAKSESRVIIGASGTGKSVMIKCIQGLISADSGSIKIDGQETIGRRGRRRDLLNRKMGMLFQNAALFDSMTVAENVGFGLVQGMGMKKNKAYGIALEKLEMVGLDKDTAGMYPAQLSGGMRKRVGLARAIAGDPEIIFFDEPTTGLDPIMSQVINDLIVQCVKKLGATAITITHDMISARKIADKITMLYQGKNVWTGNAKDIDNSDNQFVRQFVGAAR
ncbi:MAG: ATP-binding cassette domain-containing protein [Alphaproteobacteria bacterium]|nr:ATP-binding cassette domain-containing protein [Alphaproteobacteria bacterium]